MGLEIIFNLGFLFWFFLIGLIIACVQDLKRTEIDNWLNYFLFVGGGAWIIFSAIFSWDYWILIYGGVVLVSIILLSELVYHARIYAGGDYKLLVSMFAIFASASFLETFFNIGVFLLFLLISGAVWGMGVSVLIYSRNFSSVNKEIKRFFKNRIIQFLFFGCVILFALSYLDILFMFFSIFAFFSLFLFIFVKSIENKAMIGDINTHELREGDWLVKDIKFKGKIIKANWEGISKKELRFLKSYKGKIKIRKGIPFVPAFLIAFLAFWFLKDKILAWT